MTEERSKLVLDDVSRVVSCAFLAAIILTPRLWVSRRPFPVFEIISLPIPRWGEIALVIALGTILYRQIRGQFSPATVTTVMLVLLLSDGMRAQPWFYQYLLTFSILSLSARAPLAALTATQILVASIYIWSGLHKINVAFVFDLFPWLAQPLLEAVPSALTPVLAAAFFAPVIEAATGTLLLFERTRRLGAIAAIAMHLLILIALGPVGRGWNVIIWPWNVAMICLVIILYWRTPAPSRAISSLIEAPLLSVPLALGAFLPAFAFFGWWPAYFSWALYSADIPSAQIRIKAPILPAFPSDLLDAEIGQADDDPGVILFDPVVWTSETLGVVPPPELNVFRGLSSYLCRELPTESAPVVIIRHRPPRLARIGEEERATCR